VSLCVFRAPASATIESRPNASLIQTLSGQVAGLDISVNSGQPGANARVVLRGATYFGNVEPLFIIDGIPVNGDNFRSLNPNEIESVYAKDAGATAIYGNRGANGVVIIKLNQV
jgi:TonB-dependent SusC/RagA subfamily outer membrane receptor